MNRRSGWLRVVTGLCVVAVCTAMAVAIFRSPGFDQVRVDPDDGTVWVTAEGLGMFGRISVPNGSLDSAFAPPGDRQAAYQLDLVQVGEAVVVRDRTAGRAYPVDLPRATPQTDAGAGVPSGWLMEAGGGTIATLDPRPGDVRVVTVVKGERSVSIGGLDSTTKATFSVGADQEAGQGGAQNTPPTDLAVGLDGRVHVASVQGRLVTMTPGKDEEPATTDLGGRLQGVRVTAVGHDPVVLDPRARVVILPGGKRVDLPETTGDLILQRPGPAADHVLVVSARELWSVGLADGEVTSMGTMGTGRPARPVREGHCVVAAWSGTPGVAVRGCAAEGRPKLETVRLAEAEGGLQAPDLRLRGTSLVLNDVARGYVWDLRTGRRLDDWQRIKPAVSKGKSGKDDREKGTVQPKAPKAVADEYGVRPGQSSILHVLDNDSDPGGQVLAVTTVSNPSNPRVKAVVSADGQTIEVTTPADMGETTFNYTLTDGRGQNSSARVTLRPRAAAANSAPHLRTGHRPRAYSVPSGGSIVVPVLADWRDDKDGDPVALVSASSPGLQVGVTKDGSVDISAAVGAGRHQIAYVVGDGRSTSKGVFDLEVLDVGSTSATPPTAMPDFASGQVGRPVVIRPLDNDLPGADPGTPSARLRLAGDVAAPEGSTVTTNRSAGTVTVSSANPGTFFLSYSAAYGDAPVAKATIRVDMLPAAKDATPIAATATAVVRGQGAVTVDALAASRSPAGRVLSVSRAEATDPAQLQVGVVRGRWVRVQSLRPTLAPAQQIVRYTVEDGVTAAVTGTIIVTQLPPLPDAAPVTADDHATVRVGDSVTIPVLDQDEDPAGGELNLVQVASDSGTPGKLPVLSSGKPVTHLGSAYLAGRVIRFQAPEKLDNPTTVQVNYVAQNSAGLTAEGHAFVRIEPEPSQARANQAPEPAEIEGRIVAGDTTVLQIAASGSDPDGDSVAVIGLSSAPKLGRVLGFSSNTLTYQAYPTTGGTDTLSYVVQDKYGKRGVGVVRLAVVPPGDPQPPVAVEDTVIAPPGGRVLVDALANDLVAPGQKITIPDLAATNGAAPKGVEQTSPRGPFLVQAGTGPQPVTFRYGITNGIGRPSVAAVTVRTQEGYRAAPFAANTEASAKQGDANVTVDVLAKARAADGDQFGLRVGTVFAPDVRTDGGRLTVPVGKTTRFVGYEVLDRSGAATMAVLTVPPVGAGTPHPTADKIVTVPKQGNVTINLADFITDPAGGKVSLVPGAPLQGSPEGSITAEAVDPTHVKVTAANGYVGPASLALQITTSEGDKNADKAILVALPVQVGPETPVLRCPPSSLTAVAGGPEQRFDVLALCHVWTAKPGDVDKLQFRGQLSGDTQGLQVSMPNGHTLALSAGGNAKEGQRATLKVDVPGTEAKSASVNVLVRSPYPPTVAPVELDGVMAGKTASVNLTGYVSSPLGQSHLTLVSLEQTSGMAAKRDVNGMNIAITPDAASHGTMTFAVTVSDVADRTRTDRHGRGTITLRVVGVPAAPGAPVQAGPPQNGAVVLGWSVPNNNGAPIDRYRVTWPGGTQECATVPCTITGLTNGVAQSFKVAAHNAVGWGPESPGSAPIMSDARPGPVKDAKATPGDNGTITLSWAPPEPTGSPVTSYVVTWPGGRVTTSGTQVSLPGLDTSGPVTFTIVAVNKVGPGEPVTVSGQAAGRPGTPAAPTLTLRADGGERLGVTISWAAVAPNGPGPLTYTVTRSGGGSNKTICTTGSLTCRDEVRPGSTGYSYAVTATNAAGLSSPAGPAATLGGSQTPEQPSGASATVTPGGQIQLTFTPPRSAGAPISISCTIGNRPCTGAPWQFTSTEPVTKTIQAVPGAKSLTLTACAAGRGEKCAAPLVVPVSAAAAGTVQVKATASGPSVTYQVSTVKAAPGTAVMVTVATAAGTVDTQRFTTGNGPNWSTERAVRVGYKQKVTVTATLAQSGGDKTASATAQTSAATVTVTGKAVGATIPVTVTVKGMAPNSTLSCTVLNKTRNKDAKVTITTDAAGAGTVVVPATALTVQNGDTVVATCDPGPSDPGIASEPTVLPTRP